MLIIDYFGKTDIGRIRKGNEDYFALEKVGKEEYLFIVADGMGGHRAGATASKLATTTFLKSYKKLRRKEETVLEAMNHSLNLANEAIVKKSSSDFRKHGMGTTFSGLIIAENKAHIIHVGDSRVYMVRSGEILQLTKDNTYVNKMVEEGRLTEEEARNHPQRNILYLSLGARKNFNASVNEYFKIRPGDKFIICSDGLNNMVTDPVIKDHALQYKPREAAEKLVGLANSEGGIDNVTVLVINIGGDSESKPKTAPAPIKKPVKKVDQEKTGKIARPKTRKKSPAKKPKK